MKDFFFTNFSLKYLQIIGDGNCFFRALSLFFFGSQNFHQNVRTVLRNYTKDCIIYFQKNFDIQENELKKNQKTKWGCDIDIIQASRLFKCYVFIFSPATRNTWLKYDSKEKDIPKENKIFLTHTNNNHYDLLLPLEIFNKE